MAGCRTVSHFGVTAPERSTFLTTLATDCWPRKNYPKPFPLIEAEFDHLPFPVSSVDLAIYNSSFHYSVDYSSTLNEAKRCLRPNGRVVILDSPVYRCHEHGLRMVEERHSNFLSRYGFRSDAIASIEFLDEPKLEDLATELQHRVDRSPALVRMAVALAALAGANSRAKAAVAILDSHRQVQGPMIILLHPQSTKPKNRRFPLAVLSLAAVLEGKEEYAIVDGNADTPAGYHA